MHPKQSAKCGAILIVDSHESISNLLVGCINTFRIEVERLVSSHKYSHI